MTLPFRSQLAGEIKSFLAFKRALGFRYARPEFCTRAADRVVTPLGATWFDHGEE
jgi:hypothetical protein